jgi:predicted Zn-dependent peptidase
MRPALVGALAALGLVGCEAATPVAAAPHAAVPPPSPPVAVISTDPLGPRPAVAPTPAFTPPVAEEFSSKNGIRMWLVERHQVPMVSCDLTVPVGASSDPRGKAGTSHLTARMLQEGAGKRGAIELAGALGDIGARLTTDANADASFVSVTVLKHNLAAAFAIFADVIMRPQFEPAEFKRVKDLWSTELLQREKDPDATARVVYRAVLFGPDHPYGHPWDGTPTSAKAVTLGDVKRAYVLGWRPDRATLVCVGDITKAEFTATVESSFGSWIAPKASPPPTVIPPAAVGPWPKLVLVDRAGAPQAVIAALSSGIAVADPEAPALWRVNDAIGGSFTSRLNQDLREQRGYTYGARSRYSVSRGPGQLVSWANVVTDKTGDALAALVEDLDAFAKNGMTDVEVERTRSQARGELVGAYESVESIAGHLAADASLGLGPDWQVKYSERRDLADKAELDGLAKRFYDPASAILVVVGPSVKVKPMIEKLGLPSPELRDAEGNRLK